MSGFNQQMQSYRYAYLIKHLPKDMHSYWNQYQKRRMKETYIPQFKSATNRKSIIRIIFEIVYLFFYWGCWPYHYFRYGLYNQNYSIKIILDYLPETVFYYRILPKINTEPILLDDKALCYDILKAHNLPIPSLYFRVIGGKLYDDEDNIIVSQEQFTTLLCQIGDNKHIIGKKNLCGSGGHDVLFFQIINHKLMLEQDEVCFDVLCNLYEGWLFQEKLNNVPQLQRLYPFSLNTYRVLTLSDGSSIFVLYVMLKLGNNYSKTDNAHTGGMYVNVNIQTGELAPVAYDEFFNVNNKHPLTDISFSGIFVNIKPIISLVKKAAIHFPQLKCIGWDIAETGMGPVIIEGNSSPGLTIIQRTNWGMRDFIDLYIKLFPN